MSDDMYTRRWEEKDWESFKTIRLEALSKHENFFAVSVESASAKEDNFWKNTLLDVNKAAIFGLYDSDKVIGLTAIFRDWRGREGVAVLAMSYVREDYRNRRLSDLLYGARIEWAKEQGDIHTLVVGHREGNHISRSANQRWGFVLVSTEQQSFGDGVTDTHYTYELKI